MLPPSPLPLTAVYATLPKRCSVTFDRLLQPAGGLDTGNWAVRFGNNLHVITGSSSSGDVVTVLLGGLIPNVGPDQVTYAPPPFDVIGENGAAAKSFSGFPVT